MTIHQLLNARGSRIADSATGITLSSSDCFFADGSESLVVYDGDFFVAIDRNTKRFAAQKGNRTIRGRADIPLTAEELAILSTPPNGS